MWKQNCQGTAQAGLKQIYWSGKWNDGKGWPQTTVEAPTVENTANKEVNFLSQWFCYTKGLLYRTKNMAGFCLAMEEGKLRQLHHIFKGRCEGSRSPGWSHFSSVAHAPLVPWRTSPADHLMFCRAAANVIILYLEL